MKKKDTQDANKKSEGPSYRFGTGNDLIDMNILSGPDIERAVNGKPLPDESKDDKLE